MADFTDFKFTTPDNKQIYTAVWQPQKGTKVKAAIQLSHGMAEHISRYHRFASFLAEHGYVVYGNDHRGHGKTAGVWDNVGFFAEKDGFNLVVNDLLQLTEIIKEKHESLPVFFLGHSMGSLLVRNAIQKKGEIYAGAIISGTIGHPGLLGRMGQAIAKTESLVKGKRSKSPLLDKLSFGSFNQRFKPNRTAFDWLSKDEKIVDQYIADPYCGTVFSAGFFSDLFEGLYETFSAQNMAKTPKELSILMFSGEKDPVGDISKVKNIYQSYLNLGIQDISLKVYSDGRHEMLNEINANEVFEDVVNWCNSRIDSK